MNAHYTAVEIDETLAHILEYHMFATSPRAQDFLKYIVTEDLAGRSRMLSGTTIGQDVFKKGTEFDPVQDSVVRVYARRLRFMLRDYYLDHPDRDPIIMTVPKGGYKPLFERNERFNIPDIQVPSTTQLARNMPSKVSRLLAVLLMLTAGVFVALWCFSENRAWNNSQGTKIRYGHNVSNYPTIAVAPF